MAVLLPLAAYVLITEALAPRPPEEFPDPESVAAAGVVAMLVLNIAPHFLRRRQEPVPTPPPAGTPPAPRPALEDIEEIVSGHLGRCSNAERRLLHCLRIEPAEILGTASARPRVYVVVARRGPEALLYDESSYAFEIALVDDELRVLETWDNKYSLQEALFRWLHDRPRTGFLLARVEDPRSPQGD